MYSLTSVPTFLLSPLHGVSLHSYLYGTIISLPYFYNKYVMKIAMNFIIKITFLYRFFLIGRDLEGFIMGNSDCGELL